MFGINWLTMQHNHCSNNDQRVAALDLGSNTLRLLAAEIEPYAGLSGDPESTRVKYRVLARALATPRLGRGLAQNDRLDPAAKAAARKEASAMAKLARKSGARVLVLAATQACRKAADGAEFVAGLGEELGLDRALVLSGRQEAAWSRLGVLNHLEGALDGAWLADVGGGSSEIMDLNDPAGEMTMSLPLGAVTLGEAHMRHDPPAQAELEAMARAARELLQPLAGLPIKRLVATAGTAATLASMVLKLGDYQPERINNLAVSRERLNRELARLAALPLAKRKQVPGLEPERADIILAGLVILDALMEQTKTTELTLMDAGLLEGILLQAAGAF